MTEQLTHVDSATGLPGMVDVNSKATTKRVATAQSVVVLGAKIMEQLVGGDIVAKKGPVFQTAIIAGTMAVKQTSSLIPFCHPLAIEGCKIIITPKNSEEVLIECSVTITGKTGVEMEALTGASVAALTIYDMCKAMSHDIVISETRLVSKTGGKSDYGNK